MTFCFIFIFYFLRRDLLFYLIQCFKTFLIKKINILCILWFNVSRLFILHTYTQNSLHFNSPFSPLALLPLYILYTHNLHAIPCNLPSIFQRHLPSFNIVVSSNPNLHELAITKKGRPAFYSVTMTIMILMLRLDVVDLWVL